MSSSYRFSLMAGKVFWNVKRSSVMREVPTWPREFKPTGVVSGGPKATRQPHPRPNGVQRSHRSITVMSHTHTHTAQNIMVHSGCGKKRKKTISFFFFFSEVELVVELQDNQSQLAENESKTILKLNSSLRSVIELYTSKSLSGFSHSDERICCFYVGTFPMGALHLQVPMLRHDSAT